MKKYYFTYIQNLPYMVQPVYAESREEATEIIESRYGKRYAVCYTEMQWPTIKSRMEKNHARNLTVLSPIAKAK